MALTSVRSTFIARSRRPQLPRIAVFVAGLVALAALMAGCGGSGSRQAITRLSGTVADLDDGSPVIGAQVTVDGTSRATTTTVRGSFFLDAVDLGQGWHTVRAQKQIGGAPWTGERAVLFDAAIPVQTNLLILISPASRKGTIRGQVSAAGGAPLQNVTVFLNPGTNVAAAYRITDSNGRYDFGAVPAGTYTVVASAQTLVNSATSQVAVTPGAVVTINLTMLVSAGTNIAAPSNLTAEAFTYPDRAASVQSVISGVHRWLRAQTGSRRVARDAHRFRIQDWPAGSIIEVDLAWSPPAATDLAGYVLDRAVGNDNFGTIDQFADPTATAYDDLDPIYTPDQLYRFRLSAASTNAVQSAPSNIASALPLGTVGGLSPADGTMVSGAPSFSWQAVPRAQRYQVLVLSRLPELSDFTQMPLVWPPANNLPVGQTAGTQLAYTGPAFQPGVTYFWVVFASDQADFRAAQALSGSRIQMFTAR